MLTAPQDADLDDLYSLHADPAVWEHLPSGRHTSRRMTEDFVSRYRDGWQRNGLDVWVARSRSTGALVGIGGASIRGDRAWNLYYRLVPAEWGKGYAQEIVAAARDAAAAKRPDLPVVAYLLEHNRGSRRAAERAGLQLVWRGPDAGNPDADAIRLVFADRPLDDATLAVFTS